MQSPSATVDARLEFEPLEEEVPSLGLPVSSTFTETEAIDIQRRMDATHLQ